MHPSFPVPGSAHGCCFRSCIQNSSKTGWCARAHLFRKSLCHSSSSRRPRLIVLMGYEGHQKAKVWFVLWSLWSVLFITYCSLRRGDGVGHQASRRRVITPSTAPHCASSDSQPAEARPPHLRVHVEPPRVYTRHSTQRSPPLRCRNLYAFLRLYNGLVPV